MSTETSTLDFLNLYLGPFLQQKSLDLLKLRLIRQARKQRTEDPALSEVTLIRQTLRTVGRKRKSILAQLGPELQTDPAFLELLKLPPADALVLCSKELFPLPMRSLALALQLPEESLRYRMEQLMERFRQQNLSITSLKDRSLTRPTRARSIRHRGKDLIASFNALPMVIRFLVETSFVLLFLLILLWFIPEMRNRYEATIQARINEYLVESALLDSPPPEGTSREPTAPAPSETAEAEAEDFVAKSSSEQAPVLKKQPKVSDGETWRFSFTGSATSEMETGIEEALRSLRVAEIKPLNVPGGIQFDFVLETSRLLPLKELLEKSVNDLQRRSLSAQTQPLAYANLSWYKKKNMGTRKIPQGHVQVIVWISTL